MLIREYELSPEASRSMKGEVSLDVTSPQTYREYRRGKEAERIGKDRENKSTAFPKHSLERKRCNASEQLTE
jgi:hypothetical protein